MHERQIFGLEQVPHIELQLKMHVLLTVRLYVPWHCVHKVVFNELYAIQLDTVDVIHDPFAVAFNAKNGTLHVIQLALESHVAQG